MDPFNTIVRISRDQLWRMDTKVAVGSIRTRRNFFFRFSVEQSAAKWETECLDTKFSNDDSAYSDMCGLQRDIKQIVTIVISLFG